jgi:hypothetical protein
MNNLRDRYLQTLLVCQKAEGKQLISKSAVDTGPQIVALKAGGKIVGFGMAEPYDVKQELSKSVQPEPEQSADLSLFDSLFPFLQSYDHAKVETRKSAESPTDPNKVLAGLFPQDYLSWPI